MRILRYVMPFLAISIAFFGSPAYGAQVLIDALTPGSVLNCDSPFRDSYGNTVVAGTTTTITQVEFVVYSSVTIPANALKVRISTGAPMSTTGTLAGDFSQYSVTNYPADGANYYLVKFTGSANVTSGTTYYIQSTYTAADTAQGLCVSRGTYTATGGWNFGKSYFDYINLYSGGTFTNSYYHKFRLSTGPVDASVVFNTFSLLNGATSATYGIPKSITANVSTPSRVTFYANKKRIGNCVAIQSTGSSPNIVATCNWKPALHGMVSLYAQATPIDPDYTQSKSSSINVAVVTRTSQR